MTTKANAISNRLRQIRDRSRPTTKARSAGHEAGVIYAHARLVYLDGDNFTATFPDQSLLVVGPAGPVRTRRTPRPRQGRRLARARQLPAHSPAHLSDSSHHDAIQAICTRATSGPARA